MLRGSGAGRSPGRRFRTGLLGKLTSDGRGGEEADRRGQRGRKGDTWSVSRARCQSRAAFLICCVLGLN